MSGQKIFIGQLLVAFFCALVLGACSSETEKAPEPEPTPVPEMETTDMVFSFDEKDIPAGFVLDTLFADDTIKQVTFTMYRFKGLGDSLAGYNQAVEQAFMAEVRRELVYYNIPASKYEGSDVEFGPKRIVRNGQHISTQFIKDSYSSGGNHHNYSWYSLNYDRSSKGMIWFSHEFRLRTQQDSVDLGAIIGRHMDQQGIGMSDCCSDTIDFCLDGMVVEFGPDLSWANGMHTARVQLDSLERFLHRKGSLWKQFSRKR